MFYIVEVFDDHSALASYLYFDQDKVSYHAVIIRDQAYKVSRRMHSSTTQSDLYRHARLALNYLPRKRK